MSASTTSLAGESAPAAVRLNGVTKRFGEAVAVDALDLVIEPGEFFAMLGPSGCGKTTTLRMIGGFEDPSEGSILLYDVDITHRPPHQRDLNTVFQSYALFPHLDVFNNVAFGLRRRHVDRSLIAPAVSEHLELVGLGGYERRAVSQLSGGQQQRVALARALVNRPKVLLLDEPMGALDAKIRQSMRVELKRIQRDVGITFIYVTHDQEEAMSLGDRVAVMRGGRFEDVGEPHRVYDRPANRFVAEFLGDCNVVPVLIDGADTRLPGGAKANVDGASDVSAVGVRPEKVRLDVDSDATMGSMANAVRASIAAVVYLGAVTRYELATSWGGTMTSLVQSTGQEARFVAGDAVIASWESNQCFPVDAE